ncbi:MAG TPA: hypothetical protein VFB38_01020 [Chthonomonadaceae bacterium]|nr:hypothetical protein [Chthonomonadaceae bacterium]
MSSQPERHASASQPAPVDAQEQVQDYLDYLCAPLLGIVPYAVRQSFRQEAEAHLWAIVEEYQEQGLPEEKALYAAMQEHGDPSLIGQAFVEAWSEKAPRRSLARRIGPATWRAFGFFGVASALCLLTLEIYTLNARKPDLPLFLFVLAPVAPVAAGCLTGLTTSAQVAAGTCRALIFLILHMAVISLLVLPRTEIAFFTLFQLLYWLPMGCLSAAITSLFLRWRQRQRFPYVAR